MDNPTLAIANALINLFFAINFLVTAIQRKFTSLYYISGAFLSLAIGFVFILAFGNSSFAWTGPFGNASFAWTGPLFNFILGSFFIFYFAGIRPYANLSPWPKRFWFYLAAGLVSQFVAVLFHAAYLYRVTAFSVITILVISDMYLSTRKLQKMMKRSDRYVTQAALIGYMLYILVRLIFIVVDGSQERFLTDTAFESTVTLVFMMLSCGVYAAVVNLIDNRKVISILKQQNDLFEQQSITDQLTGFRNRRYLEKIIANEIGRHTRYKRQMSMILLDIDHFKKINDQYGHPMGDKVLIELTRTITSCSRDIDMSIRMGGEEFMTLLPETGLYGAKELAERIRSQIEMLENPVVCSYTVSLGISEMIPGENFESWYKRTDNALYAAKEQGRNRVIAV